MDLSNRGKEEREAEEGILDDEALSFSPTFVVVAKYGISRENSILTVKEEMHEGWVGGNGIQMKM